MTLHFIKLRIPPYLKFCFIEGRLLLQHIYSHDPGRIIGQTRKCGTTFGEYLGCSPSSPEVRELQISTAGSSKVDS